MDVRFFDSPPPISSPFNEKCEMIILASQTDLPIISIASLDYYKDSLSYFTFKSAVNEKVLFEASFADAKFWKNIVIYTHALLIQYSGQIKIQLEKVINHNGDVQKGIMASPSYTGFPIALKDPFLLYQISSTNSVAASLTVKSASPGSIATLVLNNENTNISLTNNLKTTQVSKTFDLYFSETEAKNGGFLIQYTLQPGNKSTVVKLTTSKPTFVYHLDDMKHYDILTVCSSNNQTLELFTSTNLMTLSGYKLYDSNTLSNIVKR
uniref:Uncharacterized protein n=1 Tax=Panagrolaimus davidi TaxID=227884 RepID=A0A914QEY5_9BILA